MAKPKPANQSAAVPDKVITKQAYLFLARLVDGKDRVLKRIPHADALRSAGDSYDKRDYVAAYSAFRPAHEKIVADMQRILARNPEFEANKLAMEKRVPLAAAKKTIEEMKGHAREITEQSERILRDLENKSAVRLHVKKLTLAATDATARSIIEGPETILNSASETRVESISAKPSVLKAALSTYKRLPFVSPALGGLYSVQDKSGAEQIIRVIEIVADGQIVQVEKLVGGVPTGRAVEVATAALSRQAEKGLCSLLIPIEAESGTPATSATADQLDFAGQRTLRIDSQNFSRCCADINRANIRFDTQLIKDIADGSFRAGKYEQAFLNFEQATVGFNAALGSSRRTIADGRRALTAEKGNLSGKEIQERTAAFIRTEHLIHTAEREFNTILEGLRMHLRSNQSG